MATQRTDGLGLIRDWIERYHNAVILPGLAERIHNDIRDWAARTPSDGWQKAEEQAVGGLRVISLDLEDQILPAVEEFGINAAPFETAGECLTDLRKALYGLGRCRDLLALYTLHAEEVRETVSVLRAREPIGWTSIAEPLPCPACVDPDEGLANAPLFTKADELDAHFQEAHIPPNPHEFVQMVSEAIGRCREAYRGLVAVLSPATAPAVEPAPAQKDERPHKTRRAGRRKGVWWHARVRELFKEREAKGEVLTTNYGGESEELYRILRAKYGLKPGDPPAANTIAEEIASLHREYLKQFPKQK
jgi:hypothetical protein